MTLEKAARWAQVAIATIALFVALRYSADVFAPLALGLVLGVVLTPISTWLERVGTPKALSALATLVFSLVVLAAILLFLGPVLSRLYNQAPQIWYELRISVRQVQNAIQGISAASEDIARMISPAGAAQEAEGAPRMPSVTDALLAAPVFAAQLLIFMGSLFFFVLSRQEIYSWISDKLTAEHDLMRQRLEEADRLVSRYFLTITVVNIGFGACVTAALALIGMPSPILWGVIATLLNFILYLGPASVALMLIVAGVVVFDGLTVVLPAALFLGLNLAEGQFVTPMLVGRHMSVNPLLVFLSLVFWLWLWGPLGGIIAIPLLIWGLAIAGQLGTLKPDPRLSEWARLRQARK